MNVNQLINEINNIEDIEVPYKEDEDTEKEISDEDKSKMIELMELHNNYTEKLIKINTIKKDLKLQINFVTEELQELMEKYNLEELYRNSHKFVLEKKFKKQNIKMNQLKNIISIVVGDDKAEEVFATAEKIKDIKQTSSIKCHSYN
jgi:hypothetical protein